MQGNLQAIQRCYGPLRSINDAIIHLTYLHFTSIQLIRPVKSILILCWARDKRDPPFQIKADFVSGRKEGGREGGRQGGSFPEINASERSHAKARVSFHLRGGVTINL